MMKSRIFLLLRNQRNISSSTFAPQCRSMSRQVGKASGKPKKPVETGQGRSPETIEVFYNENVGFSTLLRPFGFACLVTGCSFGGCALWQYEEMRLKSTAGKVQRYANSFLGKRGQIRSEINKWYQSLSQTQKLVVGIIAANVAVFGCWQIPGLRMFMIKWFAASPAAPATCLPMLLSTFSQNNLLHLAFNMIVLWSFTPSIGRQLGTEQFLAFYLTAGVWSSFGSYVVKVATRSCHPSIGASGAIMAVLAAFCTMQPEGRLSILFLPFFSFPAGMALKCLMGFETMGILLRWKLFDHAAHLSGLLFGCYYVQDGYKRIWGQREPFVRRWHEWREKPVDK